MSSYQYKNIMEILVEQEVSQQLSKIPAQITQYLRPVEVMTYALNRLPPLYACSEKGLEEQLKKAKQQHGPQIVQAVRWGISAVQRDPLRKFTPFHQDNQEHLLQELRQLLKDETLDWDTLPHAIEKALLSAAYNGEVNPKQPIHRYGDTEGNSQGKRSVTWQDYKRRRNLSTGREDWNNPWSSR